MEKIFESKENFQMWDYNISHRRLLLRGVVPNIKERSHHNIDIVFTSTYYIGIETNLSGIKIYKHDKPRKILAGNKEIYLERYFEIRSQGKSFLIGADLIRIETNTLDTMTTNIGKS